MVDDNTGGQLRSWLDDWYLGKVNPGYCTCQRCPCCGGIVPAQIPSPYDFWPKTPIGEWTCETTT